jgi:hypothetical protein
MMDLMQYEVPPAGRMVFPGSWFPDNNEINYFKNDRDESLILNPDEKIENNFEQRIEIHREMASPIFKITNFSAFFEIHGQDKSKNLFGNFYILDLDSINSHFHFLNDQVGEYLSIKKTVNDLKLLVVAKKIATIKKSLNDHNKTSKVVYDILSKLDMFEGKVINLNKYKSLHIENVFLTQIYWNKYIDKTIITKNSGNHPKTTVGPIRNSFLSEKNLKNIPTRKLFISRMNESNRIRQLRKKYDELSLGDLRTFKIFKTNLGSDLRIKILDRFISLSDEKELEDFFAQNGYEIVNPGSYSFEEQLEMFSSATHVAGISGAAFINTIFCKPGTKVIILNTSSRYNFPHYRWPVEAGMKTLCVPEIVEGIKKDFSTKDMIKDIEKRGIRL